jgi:hypothetical protein
MTLNSPAGVLVEVIGDAEITSSHFWLHDLSGPTKGARREDFPLLHSILIMPFVFLFSYHPLHIHTSTHPHISPTIPPKHHHLSPIISPGPRGHWVDLAGRKKKETEGALKS